MCLFPDLDVLGDCRSRTEGQKNTLGMRLVGEACIPNIDIANLRSIFVDKPPLAMAPSGTPGSSQMSSSALSQTEANLDLERRTYSYGLVLARVQAPMPSGVIRPAGNVSAAPGSVTNLSIKNPGKVCS